MAEDVKNAMGKMSRVLRQSDMLKRVETFKPAGRNQAWVGAGPEPSKKASFNMMNT